MKKRLQNILFILILPVLCFSQQTLVKGTVLDDITRQPLPDVTVSIENSLLSTKTDANGAFLFDSQLPLGEQILKLEKVGYVTKRYPIIINEGALLEIYGTTLEYDQSDKTDLYVISISDDNLNSDNDGLTDNVSGLLQVIGITVDVFVGQDRMRCGSG